MVDIKSSVAKFGTEAVHEYRVKPAIKDETKIPENCLSLSIASNFISQSMLDARVEVSYTEILRDLNIVGTDISPKFGGQRADIAIYDRGMPSAVIEVKIIDEGRIRSGVVSDWQKIALLQQYLAEKGKPILPGYVGAMVCGVYGKEPDCEIHELCKDLGISPAAVEHGDTTEARSLKGWRWVFVCAEAIQS